MIELEDQVRFLMSSYKNPKSSRQVNQITLPCELCSGPHDTRDCTRLSEQAFADYASIRTDGAGEKWYTFKPEQNNLGNSYNPSWRNHPNLKWNQNSSTPQSSSSPPNSFNSLNTGNPANLEAIASRFMSSQETRLTKLEADFKRRQGEMTNKLDALLKAFNE